MKKIKTIIIDDEIAAAENIQILLENYCPEMEVMGMEHSISKSYKLIKDTNPDLIFLDISMPPEGTGFDLLEMFPHRKFHVIFVTAHQEYSLKAIKQRAFDYLLKPIDYKELIQTVGQFSQTFSTPPSSVSSQPIINLATDDGTHIVKQKDIIYCRASGSYTEFFIQGRSNIIISKPLKFAESQLDMNQFKRVHRSFIINPQYITKITKEDGGSVFLDEVEISVSKNYCQNVFDLVNHPMQNTFTK